MTASSPPFPSYGATSPVLPTPCHDDSDQTLANTPLLGTSDVSIQADDDCREISPQPTERTLLILPTVNRRGSDGSLASSARSDHERIKRSPKSPRILIITLVSLCFATLSILLLGFMLPEAVQEYAKKAADVKLDSLSVDSFTEDGIRVRIQGRVVLDAERVKGVLLRNMGVLVGSVARKVKIGSSKALLYLPDYPEGVLGAASYPELVVNLRNGQATDIDILCDLKPASLEGVKPAIDDYLSGKIHVLRVQVESDMPLTSGILPLGTHRVIQEVVLKDIPSLPALKLSRLNLAEVHLPEQTALGANVTVDVENKYPINFTIPPLGFSVLLRSCDQEFIEVAVARTSAVDIQPFRPIAVDVAGIIRSIPFALIEVCPGTGTSPLDDLLGQYVHGRTATAYVRGLPSDEQDPGLPAWLEELLGSVTLPVPVPAGNALKDILKSFSLNDVKFQLPDPDAEPDSPEASPRLSATVQAIVALPREMNAPLDVSKVIANADIFYKGRKLGEFHVPDWASATTVQREETHDLEVNARVENVPLKITDTDVFSEVVQKIIFGGGSGVKLQADGTADVKVGIASLGAFVIRGIPAKGDIVIKGEKHTLHDINPRPRDISILSSTKSSVRMSAKVTFTNPTNYTATIPYLNILFTKNGTILGNGTIVNAAVGLGVNQVAVEAFWAPADCGEEARAVGMALLGEYVSGGNSTITARAHERSIPSLPTLSKALESLEFTLPLPPPPLGSSPNPPDADPADPPRFVQSATLHVFTSTSSFELRNPFQKDTIFISDITGVATHNGTVLGNLDYEYQIAIPPGLSETPKLPVQWTLKGVGYDILVKAAGGVLKIDAKAECNVRIGRWQERLKFYGSGIGAHVHLN
ncbi:uncharacterized protein DFL_008158 [Arthrobotrys flagrans]|uniref:Pre-rRNA processing protein n=1 Tax=Arthrobotrys flagrans TaxID=97331 RepID=A0A436ZMX3_ARTFL|nr:hypothetical protein DFL_008158 [Arthrobotrys flagrans]